MDDTIIHDLPLGTARNDELYSFHTETAAVIAATNAAALHLDDGLPQRHAAQLATFDSAIKKIVKSPKTALLIEADKKRDDAYRGFAAYNKAMCLHFNPDIRAAALRVQIVIDTYKNVVNRSYEEETSAIRNLVQDLISAKYAPDVLYIGLKPFADKLDVDNNNVASIIADRDDEAASKNHVNAKKAREELNHTYKQIVTRVNTYAGKDATPAIAAFVTKMNLIVKRFNTLMKQHHSHGHHHHGTHGSETTGAPEGNNE